MEIRIKQGGKLAQGITIQSLVIYKGDYRRVINITYPTDWSVEKLDKFVYSSKKLHVRTVMTEDIAILEMKKCLESIKELGYKVVSINPKFGYIVREDGKFLEYSKAYFSFEGGICLTYKYKPSRRNGSGAIQNDYYFGQTTFSKQELDKMTDRPKLYGSKVERYKDFKEFCQYEARFFDALKKFI